MCVGFRVYYDTLNNENGFLVLSISFGVENVSASFIRSLSLAFYSQTNKVFERRKQQEKGRKQKKKDDDDDDDDDRDVCAIASAMPKTRCCCDQYY